MTAGIIKAETPTLTHKSHGYGKPNFGEGQLDSPASTQPHAATTKLSSLSEKLAAIEADLETTEKNLLGALENLTGYVSLPTGSETSSEKPAGLIQQLDRQCVILNDTVGRLAQLSIRISEL
ncbi:MAG: hypothetical protein L3J79_05875 [Candidatus Marinimicrobia bacterium]|nr:hypothetical protein [Candidatus Neomarinimicrobiota bacterium]